MKKGLLIILAIMVIYGCDSIGGALTTAQGSYTQPIVQQSFIVAPGQFSYFIFVVPATVTVGHVFGHFSVSGGSGNDIKVIITDSDGFVNYSNGHKAKVWYNSGKVTADTIDINLGPGTYYLVFNNAFSAVSNKAINANISVSY